MNSPYLDLHLADCMDLMAKYPDGHFDLAVVDPPYGLGIAKEKPRKSGRWNFTPKDWDAARPEKSYFDELARVAKVRIIWGGNYFLEYLGSSRGMIYWFKHQPVQNFADGEIAWISKDCNSKCFNYPYYGGIEGRGQSQGRIHPTQKPVALYDWIFQNYAAPGMKVLDTHLGSGSIAIAAHYAGIHLTACEIDADYFQAACARIERETSQMTLFGNDSEIASQQQPEKLLF